MLKNHLARIIATIAVAVLFSTLAAADQQGDRVQFGHDIVVQPGDRAGDLVCIACSIRVRGQAAGDAVAIAGSIRLETGAQVAGDTVAIAGDVRLESGTQVSGDVVTIGGTVRHDPQAMIAGDITSMGGAGWMLLILLAPFLFLGGIVALIVWLIQRSRRTMPAPGYPAATPSTRS